MGWYAVLLLVAIAGRVRTGSLWSNDRRKLPLLGHAPFRLHPTQIRSFVIGLGNVCLCQKPAVNGQIAVRRLRTAIPVTQRRCS